MDLMLNSCKGLEPFFVPIFFYGFLRFKESMLRGKIDFGGSWRPLGGVLGASWGHLRVSWRPLGASEGHLEAS